MVPRGIVTAFLAPVAVSAFEPSGPPHCHNTAELRVPFTEARRECLLSGAHPEGATDLNCFSSLLRTLKIPEEIQALPFSATSLPLQLINPRNPRKLHLNDDAYVA